MDEDEAKVEIAKALVRTADAVAEYETGYIDGLTYYALHSGQLFYILITEDTATINELESL